MLGGRGVAGEEGPCGWVGDEGARSTRRWAALMATLSSGVDMSW